jgi:hypothetical protein
MDQRKPFANYAVACVPGRRPPWPLPILFHGAIARQTNERRCAAPALSISIACGSDRGGFCRLHSSPGKRQMRNCHTLNVLLAIPRWAPNLLQKIGIWMVHRANSAGTFLTQRKQIMAKQNTFGVSQPLEQIYSSTLSIALFVVTIVCTLSGCDAPRSIVPDSAEQVVTQGLAFVSLGPGSPAVLSVVQRSYANATRQSISLETRGKTPGQNELRIDIYGTNNTNVGRETTLDDKPLRESNLFPEAQEALPGVPLRLSLNYVQNKYGPFGYALGTSPQGDNCVYAWQRIATSEIDVSLFNRRATISIRLRLCEPHATEAALIAPMMNLDINASLSSGSWTPEPKQLSPDLGAPGAPMGPTVDAAATANPQPRISRRPRRRGAPRPAQSEAVPAPVSTPAPVSAPAPAIGGVVVPPPPTSPPAHTDATVVPPPPTIPLPAPGQQP